MNWLKIHTHKNRAGVIKGAVEQFVVLWDCAPELKKKKWNFCLDKRKKSMIHYNPEMYDILYVVHLINCMYMCVCVYIYIYIYI